MERSLTILLPVHNAQATLAATVPAILDVVADLTSRFELLIIDDGSADATGEIAQELAQCYPQVRFVTHGRRLGREEAIQTGLRHSSGEIIFVRHESAGGQAEEIRKLWRTTVVHQAASVPRPSRRWLHRKIVTRKEAGIPRSGSAAEQTSAFSQGDLSTGSHCHSAAGCSCPASHWLGYQWINSPAVRQSPSHSRPTRPNYLAKLKHLALGE